PLAIFGAWIFALLEIYPLRRVSFAAWWPSAKTWRARREVWLGLAPFGMVAAAGVVLTLWCNYFARTAPVLVSSMPNYGTPAHKVMQAFYVWGHFVWKPWLPINLAPHHGTLLS